MKTAGGTLTLSGSNTYSGGTLVNTGTLALANTLALGQSTFDSQRHGTAQFRHAHGGHLRRPAAGPAAVSRCSTPPGWPLPSRPATTAPRTTFAGTLSGSGSLTKIGSGTLTLAGSNTYTGPTTVSQGKVVVAGLLGNTVVSVGGGASLGGTGSIAGSVTLVGGSAGGTIDLTDGAIGTLTLSDTNAADTVLSIGGTAGNPAVLYFEVGTTADGIVLSAGKVAVQPRRRCRQHQAPGRLRPGHLRPDGLRQRPGQRPGQS